MSKKTNSKAKAFARDQRTIAALSEHFNGSGSLTLAGTSYKIKELQNLLHDRGDASSAADAACSKWKTALAQSKAKDGEVDAVMIALRHHVLGEYGADSQVAVDF